MTPAELAPLLAECYTDRLALPQRHVASAIHIGDYDVNNAYQGGVWEDQGYNSFSGS